MKTQLQNLWASRSPRDRAIAIALAFVIGVALYLWLALSLNRDRVQLHATVATLRTQSAHLEQHAVELERLRTVPAKPKSSTDLRTLVQAQAGAAGLSGALTRIEARDGGQVQVVFGSVPFAEWLAWIGNLQSLQVRLDTCRIEALSTAGLVSVTATLTRPQAP